MERRRIDISTGIIFRTIFILLGLYFLYLILDIVAVFFVALVFTAAIDPLVEWFASKKVPRSVAVLLIYLVIFLFTGAIVYASVPQLVRQFGEFSQNVALYGEKGTETLNRVQQFIGTHGNFIDINEILKNIGDYFSNSYGNIFSTTADFFSFLISLVVVLSLTFYLSVKEDGMKFFIKSIVPKDHQPYVVSLAERIKEKLGRWMQGQFFLMAIVFVLDFLALYFLGVPYALFLALIGGLFEVIPYLGPILASIPAIFLGFLVSPATGLFVLLFYILIQQVENHIIVPQVMRKTVGLNPVAVILALLIGAKLGGILGAVLAVPLVAALSVFVGDLVNKEE